MLISRLICDTESEDGRRHQLENAIDAGILETEREARHADPRQRRQLIASCSTPPSSTPQASTMTGGVEVRVPQCHADEGDIPAAPA